MAELRFARPARRVWPAPTGRVRQRQDENGGNLPSTAGYFVNSA